MGNNVAAQEACAAMDNMNGNFHPSILRDHKQGLIDRGFIFDENNLATFPSGYKLIPNSLDSRHMECKNEAGDLMFTMFVKETSYDNYATLHWVSKETSDKMKADEQAKNESDALIQKELNLIIQKSWSEQHTIIIYSFKNGFHSATNYMYGYPMIDFLRIVIQFSDYEFIGFTNLEKLQELKDFVNKHNDFFNNEIVYRNLPNGVENLHIFENEKLFHEKLGDNYVQKQTSDETKKLSDDSVINYIPKYAAHWRGVGGVLYKY